MTCGVPPSQHVEGLVAAAQAQAAALRQTPFASIFKDQMEKLSKQISALIRVTRRGAVRQTPYAAAGQRTEATHSQCAPEHLGNIDLEGAGQSVAAVAGVPPAATLVDHGHLNDGVRREPAGDDPNPSPVRQTALVPGLQTPGMHPYAAALLARTVKRWRNDPYNPGCACYVDGYRKPHEIASGKRCDRGLSRVENSFEVGRCDDTTQAQLHSSDQTGDSHRMGDDQDDAASVISTSSICGRGGAGSDGTSTSDRSPQSGSTLDDDEHSEARRSPQANPVAVPVHGPLHKAWSHHQTRGSRDTRGNRPTHHSVDCQAQGLSPRLPCVDSPVREQSGGDGQALGHTKRYKAPLGARHKRTLVCTDDDRATLPLHVERIPKINYDAVMSMASKASKERLSSLLRFVRDKQVYQEVCGTRRQSVTPGTQLPKQDLATLVESGNFEATSQHCVHRTGKVFDRPEMMKGRRRVLYWPELLNQEITLSRYKHLLEPG